MTAEMLLILGLAAVVGAIGLAIGMLVVGPRLRRWADRQDEEADGGQH